MTAPTKRTSALIAACAYLAMTVIALATVFYPAALSDLEVPGPWPDDLAASLLALFIGLGVVALLDVLVAWALYRLWARTPRLSFAMAATRIVYAVILAVSLWPVAGAYRTVRAEPLTAESLAAVAAAIERHLRIWDAGLVILGVHLVLAALLLHRGGLVRKVLAWLLAIAGLGYVADSGLALIRPDTDWPIALYTFAGEMTFMVWLIFRAFQRPGRGTGALSA